LKVVNDALDRGEKVVIHCGRGISRSATLVISTLMHRLRLSYTDAFALVSAKRSCIYPNVGFQLQLFLYEKHGADPAAAEKASVECALRVAPSPTCIAGPRGRVPRRRRRRGA